MPRPLFIIVYSRDGKRQRLPMEAVGAPSWGIAAAGGYESFDIPLTCKYDELTHLKAGMRADIYCNGVLRFRGWISERKRVKSASGDTLMLSGMGLWPTLASIPCNKMFLFPGGVDMSVAMAALFQHAIAPIYPTLIADFQPTGYTVTALDARRKTFDTAVQELLGAASGTLLYGCDADSNSLDRIYLRTTDTAASLKLSVPSSSTAVRVIVDAESAQRDEGCCTRLRVIGGAPRFPNLLANGSFEEITFATTGTASEDWVVNGGFEDSSPWNYFGSAVVRTVGGTLATVGPSYAGSQCVETDNVGESFHQIRDNDTRVVPGHTVLISAHVRRRIAATASSGRLRLYWRTSAGAETLGYVELNLAPTVATWSDPSCYGYATAQIPVGAAGWRIEGYCTVGKLLWDEISALDATYLKPTGWSTAQSGTAQVVTFAAPDGGVDGGRCVQMQVSGAADNDANDARLISTRFSVTANQAARYKVRIRAVSGSPKVLLNLAQWKQDGTSSAGATFSFPIAGGVLGAGWLTVSNDVDFSASAAQAEVVIRQRGAGTIEVDAVEIRDRASDANEPWQDTDAYVQDFVISNVFAAGPVDLRDAETTPYLGRAYYRTENVSSVVDGVGALAYATAFLTERGRFQQLPPVKVVGVTQIVQPGNLVHLLGEAGPSFAASPVPVRQVNETFDQQLQIDMELSRPRRTNEQIVQDLYRQLQATTSRVSNASSLTTVTASNSGGVAPVAGTIDGQIQEYRLASGLWVVSARLLTQTYGAYLTADGGAHPQLRFEGGGYRTRIRQTWPVGLVIDDWTGGSASLTVNGGIAGTVLSSSADVYASNNTGRVKSGYTGGFAGATGSTGTGIVLYTNGNTTPNGIWWMSGSESAFWGKYTFQGKPGAADALTTVPVTIQMLANQTAHGQQILLATGADKVLKAQTEIGALLLDIQRNSFYLNAVGGGSSVWGTLGYAGSPTLTFGPFAQMTAPNTTIQTPQGTTTINLALKKSTAGETGDFLRVQNSSSQNLAAIDQYGRIIGYVTPSGQVAFTTGNTASGTGVGIFSLGSAGAMLQIGGTGYYNASNPSGMFGLYSVPVNIANATAVFGQGVTVATSGTPVVTGIQGGARNAGTATVQYAYALSAVTPSAAVGSPIAAAIGLNIAPQLGTGVTTGLGINQQGTSDLNYFYGQTIFQNAILLNPPSTSTVAQTLQGVASQTSYLTEWKLGASHANAWRILTETSAVIYEATRTYFKAPGYRSSFGNDGQTRTALGLSFENGLITGGTVAISDADLGNRTITDATTPTGYTATLTTFLTWIATMLKGIVGGANWYSAIPETLTSLKSRVDAILVTLATYGNVVTRNAPASGNAAAAEVVLGNDGRLSDSRTPTAHTHSATDITAGTLATARLPLHNLLNGGGTDIGVGIVRILEGNPSAGIISVGAWPTGTESMRLMIIHNPSGSSATINFSATTGTITGSTTLAAGATSIWSLSTFSAGVWNARRLT